MKRINLLIILIISLCCVSALSSQVVYEEQVASNGFMGMMAFKSTSKVMLTSNAKRETVNLKFTGSFMKHFNAGGAPTADITRLDKELFWNVNIDKKEYVETSFTDIRKMFEQGQSTDMMPPIQGQEEEKDEVDESEYEWEKPVIKVIKGKKPKTINGFKCNRYVIKMTMVGKHKETGIRDTLIVLNDTWNTKSISSEMKEVENFNKKLVAKLGFERPMKGLGQIFSAYKEQMKDINKEVEKLEGYSIKNTVKMTSTNHAKEAQNKSAGGSEDNEESIELGKNPLSGMLGGFAKKMAKKKMKKQTSKSTAKEVFQFTRELKSVKRVNIPATSFNIPAGYKKVTNSGMGGIPFNQN